MENMKERIAQRMSDLGLIKQSVFKALEKYLKENGFDPVSQPALSKVMTGRTKNPWFLPHLARVLECDPDWLRYGIKPAAKADKTTEVSGYITIQQYTDVRGAMGKGAYLLETEGEVVDWRVTPEWANSHLPANTGLQNLRIITGLGDSMKGLYNSGDPLIVDTGIKSVDFDAVYFFRVGDEGYVKRLQKTPGGIIVISKNPDYRDWVIGWDDDLEVFGRVLKVWEGKEL